MIKIKRINDKVAVILTNCVSTMWCAYIFAIIALISLPDAIKGGIATTISWIAQTFLQLVLLSVIMVGQDVQSKKSEKRAVQDHEMLKAELKIIKEMHAELHELVTKQQ
jgi:DNA integrity scanning protein DisA with diadenylate cyclase activity